MAHQLTRRAGPDPTTGTFATFNPVMGWVHQANTLVDRWLARRRSRRALKALTDDELRDIGVSRSAALREAARPFWDGRI